MEDRATWMRHWHQIRAVLAVHPKTVLTVGDHGVFESYLEHAGVAVTKAADLTGLPTGFDAVCAFDVLDEAQLSDALPKLAAASTGHVFVSLPYRASKLRWRFWWGDTTLSLGLLWPKRRAKQLTAQIAAQLDIVDSGWVTIPIVPDDPGRYLWHLRRRETPASA